MKATLNLLYNKYMHFNFFPLYIRKRW